VKIIVFLLAELELVSLPLAPREEEPGGSPNHHLETPKG
jgi:hypothetical protein